MTKSRRAEKVFNILNEKYPKKIIFLKFRDSYQLLIGVILSAQTTDKQVNKILPDFIKKFPDFSTLAQADFEDVSAAIKTIGFFNVKAKNIINCAKMVCADFFGKLPNTMDDLIKLPGVGRKSANVVLGEVFNLPAIIVDTHFGRVCRRVGLSDNRDPKKLEFDIKDIVEEKNQYRFSMLLNNHGRIFCFARKPDCLNCHINGVCEKNI